MPTSDEDDGTYDGMRVRIQKHQPHSSYPRNERTLTEANKRPVSFVNFAKQQMDFKGQQFLLEFALPNVFFRLFDGLRDPARERRLARQERFSWLVAGASASPDQSSPGRTRREGRHHDEFRLRLLRHRRRFGRCALRADRGRPWCEGRHRRGALLGRDLRQRRLRSEEAHDHGRTLLVGLQGRDRIWSGPFRRRVTTGRPWWNARTSKSLAQCRLPRHVDGSRMHAVRRASGLPGRAYAQGRVLDRTADKILVAVGAWPVPPDDPGVREYAFTSKRSLSSRRCRPAS